MAYVERNPLRAGMVRKAWRYEYSSAAAHADGRDERGLLDLAGWRERRPPAWTEVLDDGQDPQILGTHRQHLFAGHPQGSDSWLSKMEVKLGRRLRPLPLGRPTGKHRKPVAENR
jgi:putative transposase